MIMTSIVVIENKVSSIRKYLKILERYKKCTRREIEENVDIRGAVERYLYLVAQSSIDLAEAIIAYRRFRKPSTMGEAFHILHEEGVISARLRDKLIGMVGFRNIMAHDYEKIDYDIVYEVLHERLGAIEDFIGKAGKA